MFQHHYTNNALANALTQFPITSLKGIPTKLDSVNAHLRTSTRKVDIAKSLVLLEQVTGSVGTINRSRKTILMHQIKEKGVVGVSTTLNSLRAEALMDMLLLSSEINDHFSVRSRDIRLTNLDMLPNSTYFVSTDVEFVVNTNLPQVVCTQL